MKEQFTQFTPGPWRIDRYRECDEIYYVETVQGLHIAEDIERVDNARLIAEAPEMFRLLQIFADREYAFPDYVAARRLVARVLGSEVAVC